VKWFYFFIIILILFTVSGYILTHPRRSSLPIQFSKVVSVGATAKLGTSKKCKCCIKDLEELRTRLRLRQWNTQTTPNRQNHNAGNKSGL
jgi:hypothetical protein